MRGRSAAILALLGATPALAQEVPPEGEIGSVPAPAPPSDHAADAIFGKERMDAARATLRKDSGATNFYGALFNLAEYSAQRGKDGYRFEGEGWYGGDINRLVVKTEGEGRFDEKIEEAEVRLLYSRAIDPWFNLQAGVRQDFGHGPKRSYATLGIEGLAPYLLKVEGVLFLSDKGDLLGRVEGWYDQRITQRLILQPRAELNFAAQDVPASRIGAGLSQADIGLRLRYEIRREFAPYIGVSWEGKLGDTRRFARADGEDVQATSLVLGVRAGF